MTANEPHAAATRPHPGVLRRASSLLVSPRLAIALLLLVLAFCLFGVTAVRRERSWELVFGTLWFNGLLILLAISSAAAFFTRIWRRKLTFVSIGMIVFHVSFAALLGSVVFNGLFYFRGMLRLTEGETLPNDRLESYDEVEHGRFFDPSRLRGATTLVRMHRDFKVDGENKRAAYEVVIEDADQRTTGIVYVARHLDFEGMRFFSWKEGYSLLLVLTGKDGREIFGAHVPLQSLRQPDGHFLYAAGTAHGPGAFLFPPPPEPPRAEVLVSYRPSTVEDRAGDVSFEVVPVGQGGVRGVGWKGTVPVGEAAGTGELLLAAREVRYWVGMNVRYDPGLTAILTSLCVGLGGMVLTFVGRLRQGGAKRQAA